MYLFLSLFKQGQFRCYIFIIPDMAPMRFNAQYCRTKNYEVYISNQLGLSSFFSSLKYSLTREVLFQNRSLFLLLLAEERTACNKSEMCAATRSSESDQTTLSFLRNGFYRNGHAKKSSSYIPSPRSNKYDIFLTNRYVPQTRNQRTLPAPKEIIIITELNNEEKKCKRWNEVRRYDGIALLTGKKVFPLSYTMKIVLAIS